MKPTFNEKLIAYLTLISGLSISAVAVYYSVVGLTAIFAAAVIPIVVMGVTLEVSKLVATIWLKQNWNHAPVTIKTYLIIAIAVLMLITSMGIFGFLSKAHSDQSLVSGDVQSRLAIYDEKLKTAKENIEADRRQLKQMDEAVDQVMARSTTEEGAARSNAIRKAQARDRSALAKNIEANQKLIATLNDEAAPIRAEIRKVEAEVGPLKYIATFVYGETDKTVLEKAVTWVIIIIVLVFDPLAVVLLLASQFSFQNIKEREIKFLESQKEKIEIKEELPIDVKENDSNEIGNNAFIQKQIGDIWNAMDQPCAECGTTMIYKENVGITCPQCEKKDQNLEIQNTEIIKSNDDNFDIKNHPYLFNVPSSYHPPGVEPVGPIVYKEELVDARLTTDEAVKIEEKVEPIEEKLYVQNEEQEQSNLWSSATITTTSLETNDIESSEYVKASILRRNQLVAEYSQKVREGRMLMTDVPEDLLPLVKARV